MAFSLLSSVSAAPGDTGGTTAAIDTTGAKLLVMSIGRFNLGTVSDSESNTWTLARIVTQGNVKLEMWYVLNPVTNSSHTFTYSGGSSTVPGIAAAAYSSTGIFVDAIKTGVSTSTSIQSSALTPGRANSLLVYAQGFEIGETQSIDEGFTIQEEIVWVNTVNIGIDFADKITSTTQQPTYSSASSTSRAVILASFSETQVPLPVSFFDGFETVGTETGLANEATVRPRINLRYGATQSGISPSTTGFFLIEDRSEEGFAWNQGTNKANHLRVFTPNETLKVYGVGLSVHIPSTTDNDLLIISPEGNTTGAPNNSFDLICRDRTDLVLIGPFGTLTVEDVFSPGQWHFVEMKFTIHETTGFIEVNVDGTEVFNQSSLDTQDFFGNTVSIRFGSINLSTPAVTGAGEDFVGMDDIYILIGEVPSQVDFLGSRTRIKSLPPTGDNVKDWDTTSSGTDHWLLVDENGADASDYVETTTDTDRDEFNLTNMLESEGTFFSIKIEAEATDEGDTDNTLDVEVESGGDRSETSYTVSDSSATVYEHYAVSDPQGGSDWTKARIDAMRAGIEFNT